MIKPLLNDLYNGYLSVISSRENRRKPYAGSVLRTLTGHTGYVYSVAISADGQQLFSGSYDWTIKVWGV